MGFTEALTLVFIVLKLMGVIDWSWWLVLLPEIIAFVFYALLIVFQVSLIRSVWKGTSYNRRKRR